jgi:hypothetical protein
MAGEAKWTYAAAVTLEASGGSCGSGAFVAADDTSLASANHSNYPLADFVLKADFGAAVANGTTVNLYLQEFDAAGDTSADAAAPSLGYKYKYVGSFQMISAQSASAYYPLNDVPITSICKFSLENGTAQTLAAGWTLSARPKTLVPGS